MRNFILIPHNRIGFTETSKQVQDFQHNFTFAVRPRFDSKKPRSVLNH